MSASRESSLGKTPKRSLPDGSSPPQTKPRECPPNTQESPTPQLRDLSSNKQETSTPLAIHHPPDLIQSIGTRHQDRPSFKHKSVVSSSTRGSNYQHSPTPQRKGAVFQHHRQTSTSHSPQRGQSHKSKHHRNQPATLELIPTSAAAAATTATTNSPPEPDRLAIATAPSADIMATNPTAQVTLTIAVEPPEQVSTGELLYPPVVARLRLPNPIPNCTASEFTATAFLLDFQGNPVQDQLRLAGTQVASCYGSGSSWTVVGEAFPETNSAPGTASSTRRRRGRGSSSGSNGDTNVVYFEFHQVRVYTEGNYKLQISAYRSDPEGFECVTDGAETRFFQVLLHEVEKQRPCKLFTKVLCIRMLDPAQEC